MSLFIVGTDGKWLVILLGLLYFSDNRRFWDGNCCKPDRFIMATLSMMAGISYEIVASFGIPATARSKQNRRFVVKRMTSKLSQETPRITGVPTRHRNASKFSATGIIIVAATLWTGWAIVEWPVLHWLAYASWLTPLVELALLTAGQAAFHWNFREAPEGKFSMAIIQITTTGREHMRVSEIIDQIRSYPLKMDYQLWVVTEPGEMSEYAFADRVLVVPEDFNVRSKKKARALEYSRQMRESLELDRADVKIIFNDDDVSLTHSYIETAFTADYDICEGVITPRTAYAVRPFAHFITSHADDIRTHACLVYCSVFQGIFRRPLHVHGEGLVVTGKAESIITWNWPVVASEDLVFGYQAARLGLKWGWFHEYAEVTSPWSLREFLIQRQRWLWGDIHAVRSRDVIPATQAVRVIIKYMSVASMIWSSAGLYLWGTGAIPSTSPIFGYAKLSVLAWLAVLFSCGWIGAGSSVEPRDHESRLLSGVLAIIMMPVSMVLTVAAIGIPLIQGDPRTFKVINKTRVQRAQE